MPKFPKGFGRRRSATNTPDEPSNAPVEPSFRVFERPNQSGKSFDGGLKLAQSAARPTISSRQKEDNMFEDLKVNRGSGASNSNTASTTDNSSRLSAASTAPSSTDFAGGQDKSWPSSDRQPGNIPIPPIPKTSSGFSLKAAGRTFSFGRTKPPVPSTKLQDDSPSTYTSDSQEQEDYSRPRAVTTSSYASTATPPRIEDQELGLSLGGDFADMFTGLGHRKSAILGVEGSRAMSQSPDDFRNVPAVPARTYAGSRRDLPSPSSIDHSRDIESSPYSWSSRNSQDRLMVNSSPSLGPPVPSHGSPLALDRTANGVSNTRLQGVSTPTDNKLKRNSGPSGRRQPPLVYAEGEDEDARLLKESLNAARLLTEEPGNLRVRDSWVAPMNKEYGGGESPSLSWGASSIQSTPRALKIKTHVQEDSMFDEVAATASLAQHYSQKSISPSPPERVPKNKVMTPAQFEKYRREKEALRSMGGASKDEEDIDDEDDAYDDDDDEAERQNQAAKQRLKQEAHMSVYRQQMMKVTGETPPAPTNRTSTSQSLSNPSIQIPKSTPADDGEDEDEDVPLAILAAHGFPNKNRPPTRLSIMNSNPNLRATSQLGTHPPLSQLATGEPSRSSRLPVFARNLPPDPYLGASLVRPMNRESLAMGGGAGSAYGGSQRGLPPGGLVGVIALEERSRAMRRGSPNVAGPSANNFSGAGISPMPQMPPAMMGNMNGMGQMAPMGQMPVPVPMLTPGDQAQVEMAQQMQQFMQMQMQFMQMQMMSSNKGQPQSQNGPVSFPQSSPRTDSPRPTSSQRHTMSMLNPNLAPWQQQNPQGNIPTIPPIQMGGYAPSIAPSERSNIGLPGRYRPVSQLPVVDGPRSMTMSGALQDWSDPKGTPATVKIVRKSEDADDEDDEEGWEAMMQKREKKQSKWRSRKADSDSKEMLSFIT